MLEEWKPIDTAPRDGSFVQVAVIEVDDEDETYSFAYGPVIMRWQKTAWNRWLAEVMPMWVGVGGTATWDESRGGGPTHWAPANIQIH